MHGDSATGETRLVPATPAMRDAVLEMAGEWRDAGEKRYSSLLDDFASWQAEIDRLSRAESCPEGIVASDYLWLVDAEGTVLGSCRLRHELSPRLEIEGGHIGYDVRPFRRGDVLIAGE